MNSFMPASNPSFTSQEHWSEDAETSTRVPKSLKEQVAKTAVGRAMQTHAEERREEVAYLVAEDYEQVDFHNNRELIAELLEKEQVLLKPDGSLAISPHLSVIELNNLKESLLDVKLDSDPENRAAVKDGINGLVAKVDQAVQERAKLEAPAGVLNSLVSLKGLQEQVRKAIQEKRYHDLSDLNEKMILAAMTLLDNFEKLRASNPDKMLQMVESIQKTGIHPSQYKTALINFVKTHNSFSFSKEAEKDLVRTTLQQSERGKIRNDGRLTFVQALWAAYNAPKAEDDPYTFLQQTTRIPEKRFKQIVDTALNSN
jgi:hypothetical protein